MRIRYIDSVAKLLFGSKFIGHGATAFCFLLPTGSVVKIFYDSRKKRELFSLHENNFIDFCDYLSSFNSETFYGPTEVLMKDGIIIGYTMNLAIGKTINYMSGNISIDEIESMIENLIKDVKLVSRNNLKIGDIHQKNILYSYAFKIIDLDYSLQCTKFEYSDLVRYNMGDLLLVITKSLFKVRDSYDVYFFNPNLNNLYQKSVYRDYEIYYDFLEYLRSMGNNLKELRRAGIHYSLVHKDYYSKL